MRIGRLIKRIAQAVGILIVLLILGLAGAVAFLRTETGLAWLAGTIEAVASNEAMTLRIGALDGSFPENLIVRDLTIADRGGTPIRVDRAQLTWSPRDLLQRRLRIDLLSVGTATIDRLPALPETPEDAAPAAEGGVALPSLPVDLVIEAVSIDALNLGEPVIGQAASLAADAKMTVERSLASAATLEIRRLDGARGRVALDAAYDPRIETIRIDLAAHEPAGGLVATLLDLENRPPVSAALRGDGPIADWRGSLDIAAEGLAGITAQVTLAGISPVDIRLDGRADIENLLPADTRRLAAGGVDLAVEAEAAAETVTVRALTLSAAAGDLTGTGTFGLEDDAVSAALALRLGPPTLFDAFVPGLDYDSVTAELVADGALPLPETRLTVNVRGAAMEGARIDEADLTARVSAAGPADAAGGVPPLDARADLRLSGIESPSPVLTETLGGMATLSVDARVDPAASRAEVRELTLDAGPLGLDGTADVAYGEALAVTADVALRETDLARLRELAGLPLAGTARLDLAVETQADETLVARLTGGVEKLATGIDAVGAAVGDRISLDIAARHNAETGATLKGKIDAKTLALAADAAITADFGRLEHADVTLTAADLALFESLAGVPLKGAVTANLKAQGPTDALDARLTVDGQRIAVDDLTVDRLDLGIDAERIPQRPAGRLSLRADSSLGAVDGGGAFAVEEMSRLALTGLRVDYDRAVTATGGLTVPFDGAPIQGDLRLRGDDLSPVGERLAVQIGGALTADIRLRGDNALQTVIASLRGDGLRYGDPAAPTATVRSLDADLTLVDPAQQRRVTLSAVATDLAVGGGDLARTTLDVRGAGESFDIAVDTTGDLRGVTRAEADAGLVLGDATVVDLRDLDADFQGETLRLLRPARLRAADAALSVDGLALAYGPARADISLSKTAAALDGRVRLADVDLGLIDRFAPGTGLAGTLDATATLSGTPARPVLRLAADARGVGYRIYVEQGAPTIAADLEATLDADTADARLAVTGLGETPLIAKLVLPTTFAVEPFAFAVDSARRIDGAVTWAGEIGRLMRFAPIDEIALSGATVVDIAIAGTPDAPVLTGEVALGNGSLEVFQTGTLLRPLDLRAELIPDAVRLTRLEAGDAGKGRISGGGTVAYSEPQRVDLSLDIDNAVLVRRDDVTSKLSGTVSADGTVGERLDIVARIDNEFTEIRLIDRLPPSVDTIEVVWADEIDGDDEAAGTAGAEAEGAWIFLDAVLDMPRRVFVRGRGLASEWAGRFEASGPVDRPRVIGRLSPVRGDFTLLSRTFVLDGGEIVFAGLASEPRIDLGATSARTDFSATVNVSGTPSDLELTLSSTPELPQDEIVSRLLFDKSSGNLTALEAAQLAAAVAALASGEPGVIDRIRDAAGLDRLRFEAAGEEEEDAVGTVEAGRYIAEGVYVGVKQGATPETTEAQVEVDITDSISAKSSTSAEGKNRVGVFWEYDY